MHIIEYIFFISTKNVLSIIVITSLNKNFQKDIEVVGKSRGSMSEDN